MKEITYVTGNIAKIESAKLYLEPLGIKVNQMKLIISEIQSNSIEEIAINSAIEASNKLKVNVLKNDTGLFIESLNGFPGPYTHYVDDTINEEGILKLMEGIENRDAYFLEVYAYCEYGKNPVIFKSITKGKIATEKSGKYGWSWDFIFIPDGYDKTMANYSDKKRYAMWNTDALNNLANYLKDKD